MAHTTPSLSVPPAQNTAPVLDFRCLYTYDLRRKQKRWQDGLARFHTFNKRLMVYSESRNFIGDTHWRESGTIQDGNELQLDKGVLIQVGEETARTEQDLTELLDKRKKAQNVIVESSGATTMPNPTPYSMVQTPVSRITALRPKSLNVVLGTPKGRLGRAALPQKSPYDLRAEVQAGPGVEERPAKRIRLTAKEDQSCVDASRHVGIPPPKPVSKAIEDRVLEQPPTMHQPSCVARSKPQVTDLQVLSRVTDDAMQIEPDSSNRNQKTRNLIDQRLPQALSSENNRNETAAVESYRNFRKSDTPRAHLREDHALQYQRPMNKPSESHAPPATSRLRIVSSKPRKKLMYGDLIPKASPLNTDSFSTPTVFPNINNDDNSQEDEHDTMLQIKEPKIRKTVSASQEFHRDQRKKIRERLRKHERKKPFELDDEERAALAGTEFQNANGRKDFEDRAVEREPAEPVSSIPGLPQHVEVDLIADNEEEGSMFCTHADDELDFPAIDDSNLSEECTKKTFSKPRSAIQSPQQTHIPTLTTNQHPQHAAAAMKTKTTIPTAIPRMNNLIPPPSLTTTNLPPSLPLAPPPTPPLPAKPPHNKTPKTPLSRSHTVPSSVVQRAQRTRTLRKSLSDAAAAAKQAQTDTTSPIYSKEAVPLEPEPWSHEAWELFGERREDVVARVERRERER